MPFTRDDIDNALEHHYEKLFKKNDLYNSTIYKRTVLKGNTFNHLDNKKNGHDFLYPSRWSFYNKPISYKLGISLGHALSGSPVMIGDGMNKELKDLIISYGPSTVYYFGEERSEIDIAMIQTTDVIEINYSNAHDPIPIPEIMGRKDMIRLVRLMKEVSNAKIAIRINSTDIENDIDHILVSDIDILVVDCLPPYPIISSTSHPMISTILANEHMRTFRSRNKGLELVVDGPFRSVNDLIKLIALGADKFGTTFLSDVFFKFFSLSEDDLDWAEIGEYYHNIISWMINDIRIELKYLANGSLEKLRSNGLYASDYSTASMTGLPLDGYGKTLPIWRH